MIWADCVRIFAFIALLFYLFGCFLFFLFWTRPKIKLMKNYMAKNKRKMKMIHFFSLVLSSLLQLSGKFNIHHFKYGAAATVQNKETERNFYKKSYYHLWGFKKRYFILLVYNLLSAVYLPLSTGPRQCPSAFPFVMPCHESVVGFIFFCLMLLSVVCNFVVIFIEFSEC